MAINRYRLRHLSATGHRAAKRVAALLKRPDRLIGVILLGNNFVNILAGSITTVIALRMSNEHALAIATGMITVVILIFGEVAPKTLAALHPERVAFTSSILISPMLKILYPLVWLTNGAANYLLRLFGVSPFKQAKAAVTREELRSVLLDAKGMISQKHHHMLMSILDMESVTVEDIMVPRSDVTGIDILDDWKTIHNIVSTSQHSRIVVYEGNIDHIIGILHLRSLINMSAGQEFTLDILKQSLRKPYYCPLGTTLTKQLINFQKEKERIALIVDEYGDIQGLITLEDILEEIVGEFTTDFYTNIKEIHPQDDGTVLVDGSVNVRELNRALKWKLPTDGPRTLNGLILEYMEMIPEPGTSLRLHRYPLEIVQTSNNAVKTVRIDPKSAPKKKSAKKPNQL